MTAEGQANGRMPDYHLIMTFTADDDRQAHRVGMACARACAAEYGTRAPFVVGGGEEIEETGDDLDQPEALPSEPFRARTSVNAELAQMRQELAASRRQFDRARALLQPPPGGSVYTVPHGDWGQQEVVPAADLRAALAPIDPDRPDALQAAIEALLLNRRGQLDGDDADPYLTRLAYVYAQHNGWIAGEQGQPPGDGGAA
jgi:hypothetical protein